MKPLRTAATLPVNEMFQTVQGEAYFTGTPATFVRLMGCAVGCPWCDTKHTWEVDRRFEIATDAMMAKLGDAPSWAALTPAEIADQVGTFKPGHVVLTGGEPAMYDLRELSGILIDRGYTVQLETSGTQEIRIAEAAWVTLSPKIDMPGGFKVRDEAVYRADEIKFPIGKRADLDKLDRLLTESAPFTRGYTPDIWLQPLSQSEKATQLCIEIAMERGYKLSVQAHKYIGVR